MDETLTDADLVNAEVTFNGTMMENVVTVPKAAVRSETTKVNDNVERYYVWKQEGDMIVKEFVSIYNSQSANGKIYVLNGLEPGDKVLK